MAHATPDPMDENEYTEATKGLNLKDSVSRMEAAVALRVHGADYSEIARICGYADVPRARQAVERGLGSTVSDDDKKVRRTLESRRLERVIRSLMPKAVDPDDPEHLGYARTTLLYIDRHIRLWGLDAPAEMVMYTPTAKEVEDWLAGKRRAIEGHLPEEADIVEGEVIDDDDPDA